MLRTPPLIIALMVTTSMITAQRHLDLTCAGISKANTAAEHITVYIFSDPRCGPCHKAIRDIGTWSADKSVRLVALDLYGKANTQDPNSLYAKYQVEVHDASACDQQYKNFLPTLYAVETSTGKVLWKQKGWLSKYLRRLERSVRRTVSEG